MLEVLRQPLELGTMTVARAARTAIFPARFMLVGAMNPCPCGLRGHPVRECRCTPLQVSRYCGRLSGPLRDRIDLIVDVPAVSSGALASVAPGEPSAGVRARVEAARAVQAHRHSRGATRRQRGSRRTWPCPLVRARHSRCRPARGRRRAAGAQPPRLRSRAQGGADDRGPRRERTGRRRTCRRGDPVPRRHPPRTDSPYVRQRLLASFLSPLRG